MWYNLSANVILHVFEKKSRVSQDLHNSDLEN